MRTITFRLCASEETRKIFWYLCQEHTLLVNALSHKVQQSKEFQTWQEKGWLPNKKLKLLNKEVLEEKTAFQVQVLDQTKLPDLPSRFIASAIRANQQTWGSWIAQQRRRYMSLTGKQDWLQLQECDLDLSQTTDFTFAQICTEVREVLASVTAQIAAEEQKKQNQKKRSRQTTKAKRTVKKQKKVSESRRITEALFKLLKKKQNALTMRAIAYLLRNNATVQEDEENPQEIALKLDQKRIEIERLKTQLQSQFPKPRDPTGAIADRYINEALEKPSFATSWKILVLFCLLITNQELPGLSLQFHSHLLQQLQHPDLSREAQQAEFKSWEEGCLERMTKLATVLKSLPLPISFDSSDDLYWSVEPKQQKAVEPKETTPAPTDGQPRRSPKRKRKNRRKIQVQERIVVRFKGLREHKFGVQCSHRDLAILQQCQREWERYGSLPDDKKFSLGLFPARAARLLWRKDKQQRKPSANSPGEKSQVEEWRQYRLYLHITIDDRLLSAEGTEEVRQEKLIKAQDDQKTMRKRKSPRKKLEEAELTQEQKEKKAKDGAIAKKRVASTQARLSDPTRLKRPSRKPYQGQSHIQVRVCFNQQERVSLAVFDTQQQQVLEYVSVRDLLYDHSAEKHHQHFISNPKRKGKRTLEQMQLEQYHLLDRLRKQQVKNHQRRMRAQKQGYYKYSKSESNLGEYLDRLLAARIGQLAVQWQASSVVIPDLGNLRESVEAKLQAWADLIFPKMEEVQQKTTKKIRVSFHGWSYGRLARCIRSRAARDGLAIVIGQQPQQGSLQEKARAVAPANSTTA
ncbi:type V CRISPR-associated protein Cas12k [Leptolyngbya ohadii]|uniref:type V CRISPR-associated protein Cas12k n=1 Tax=Leptolyngbya ohadii TaxID=1962290 RepID=UPI000B59C242|nr:type V CRISPR-associated protein Cas12k [Leptolyngbya ohadii]